LDKIAQHVVCRAAEKNEEMTEKKCEAAKGTKTIVFTIGVVEKTAESLL
jgi:hypothetical protein